MTLTLLDFQQEAAERIVASTLAYFTAGQDRLSGRAVPYVGQLKAVTGAGKTPILATAVGKLSPAIVLWTTKFGSVVDQTFANLRPGGKYHHLLGNGFVEIIKFSDLSSSTEWRRILDRTDGLTILISTVAAWNSSEKDDRLNVHRVNQDWGNMSRWDQLRTERKRPLHVVYDEAHNTTSEQIELLDDLDPTGFYVASASQIKGKLQRYLTMLDDTQRDARIVRVSTRKVVEAQLLKSRIIVSDYDSSAETMLVDVVQQRAELERRLVQLGSSITPKSIYVVESSDTSVPGSEPRPVAIWRTLVNECGVPSSAIAICTNTRNLPQGAERVATIDQLSDQYTHIIFNKKLQEGWDDPSVYLCYFDGKTDSATRIQQVIGRALRQPGAQHFQDEELNSATFYVQCPTDTVERIIDQLKEELRIYKDEGTPEDFEPFQVKPRKLQPPPVPIKAEWEGKLTVPKLQPELPAGNVLRPIIERGTHDFGPDDLAAPGKALINVVSVRTGETTAQVRDLLEDMKVRCGAYVRNQIRVLSKHCYNALPREAFTNPKLDRLACYGSPALTHYGELASKVVAAFEGHVELGILADPDENTYVVGAYQPSGVVQKEFSYAAHPYYDAGAFNDPELKMARALDQFPEYVWARNKQNVDYGIPLPIKSESSSTFYPDFLWWVKQTVWAIDPTGKFILNEKIRTKLLMLPEPLKIALVTQGKHDGSWRKTTDDGWTLVRYRLGNVGPEPFDDLNILLTTLVTASK